MRAGQRESRQLVKAHHAGAVYKTARGVTAGAVGPELTQMRIGVAACAAVFGTFKLKGAMAAEACNCCVRAAQREARDLRVVKASGDVRRFPAVVVVALHARGAKAAMRIGRLLPGGVRTLGPCERRQTERDEKGATKDEAKSLDRAWHVRPPRTKNQREAAPGAASVAKLHSYTSRTIWPRTMRTPVVIE